MRSCLHHCPAGSPATQPGHPGRGGSLVDDQVPWVEVRLRVAPRVSPGQDVERFLLAGVGRFLRVTA